MMTSLRVALLAAIALAAAPGPAAAQIVYRAANIDVTRGVAYVNVLDGSYATPFTPRCPGPGCNYDVRIAFAGRATYRVTAPTDSAVSPSPVPPEARGVAVRLAPGALVGASTAFVDIEFVSAGGPEPQLVGLRFRAEPAGAVHFGWVRVAPASGEGRFRILDYAFEATPGRAIAAGDAGGATVIPEPRVALLVAPGLLALGAAARRRGRRG
jgi:hypothetical protein